MTLPSFGPVETQLSMVAENIFHIKGRGTVVTGLLEGNGLPLAVGDTAVCEDQQWTVAGIEMFRQVLQVAQPGANAGVLLRNGPPAEVLRGRKLVFVPSQKRLKEAARSRQVAGKLRRRRG